MVERKDVEAALQARHELGPEYEPQIIDAMVDRFERRLEERLRELRPEVPQRVDLRLPLASIALGIPITAVALSNAPGVGGIVVAIVAWIAIAVVNLVATLAGFARWFIPRR
jgi:hypothetical protein